MGEGYLLSVGSLIAVIVVILEVTIVGSKPSPEAWAQGSYAQSSYYYADYKIPPAVPQQKQNFLPGPQNCPETGRTLCKDVAKYPLEQVYDVIRTAKGRRFNFSSVFMDESENDDEPNLIPETPRYGKPQTGYVVYQTALHYGPAPQPGGYNNNNNNNNNHNYNNNRQQPPPPPPPSPQPPRPIQPQPTPQQPTYVPPEEQQYPQQEYQQRKVRSHSLQQNYYQESPLPLEGTHNQPVNFANRGYGQQNLNQVNYNQQQHPRGYTDQRPQNNYDVPNNQNNNNNNNYPQQPQPGGQGQGQGQGHPPQEPIDIRWRPFNPNEQYQRQQQQHQQPIQQQYEQQQYQQERQPNEQQYTPQAQTGTRHEEQRRYKRQANDQEVEAICKTQKMYITPKAALNDRAQWKFIVNLGDRDPRLRQVVKVDVCSSANQPCSNQISLPFGFTSRCKQKYIKKKLLSLDPDGQGTSSENFFVPSCCVCEIVRNNQKK